MWKTSFNIFKTHFQFYTKVERKKEQFVFGYGNRCADGRYVLFLDYDKSPLQYIQEEIRLLQSVSPLGTAYVFRTRHGYHVVFLEKMTLGTIVNLLQMTTCDYNYKEIPLKYGRKVWVLRSSRKKGEGDGIKYIGAYPPITTVNAMTLPERSNAHKLYLCQEHGVPSDDVKDGGAFDQENTITLAYYYVDDR